MPAASSRLDRGSHALRVAAAGSGPPDFLCIHGLVDRLEIWDAVAESLAAGARCVRYDQRAHGESTAPPGPCGLEDLAADALAVLDALAIERAVWIGHSLGGVVALTAALARPERVAGLVLLGTTGQCSARVAAWYERIAAAGEREGSAGLARAIYGGDSRCQIVGDAPGIARVTRALAALADAPLTPRLGELRRPVRLLVGEEDPMGPRASRILQQNLPDATLDVVPGRGHWLHVEEPDVVVRAAQRCSREAGRGG